MSKTTTTIDQGSSVALSPEALNALGVEVGAELEVEIVGRALVVRSVEKPGVLKNSRVPSNQSLPNVAPLTKN